MIILKCPVTQVSGNLSEAYLSGINEEGITHSIRDRQDFELRIAEPIEFNNESEAIKYLDLHFHECRHYTTGTRIFQEFKDRPRELFFRYEIEEV